jgi:hypothetical protein
VAQDGQGAGSFFVVLPKSIIHNRKTAIIMNLYEGDKKIVAMKTNFLGPTGD